MTGKTVLEHAQHNRNKLQYFPKTNFDRGNSCHASLDCLFIPNVKISHSCKNSRGESVLRNYAYQLTFIATEARSLSHVLVPLVSGGVM